MGRAPSHREQVEFLLQIQRLLEEALFVASYKPALLIALADVAVELGTDGEPLTVDTSQLAERFVRLYWRQAAPYAAGPGRRSKVLLQNAGKQAAIVNAVEEARALHDGRFSTVKRDPKAWNRLIRSVARTIQTMPLWKLQTVGKERLSFLYENLDKGTTVTLNATAVYCLRRFHTLVVDLAQSAWMRFLRGLKPNRRVLGDVQDLRTFLFGSDRASLLTYRHLLLKAQDGRCFYCDGALRARDAAVDHFIPWTRYPVDLGHGFVVADARCNTQKSDRLAGLRHLNRWIDRNERHGDDLAADFDHADVVHDLGASWQVTRWAYSQGVAAGAQAWIKGSRNDGVMEPIEPDWLGLLPGAT